MTWNPKVILPSPVRQLKRSLLILLFLLFCFKPIQGHAAHKRVLFINSYHKGYGWSDQLVDTVSAYLEREVPGVEIFVEYMDTKRFNYQGYSIRFLEYLSVKYIWMKPDLVIASDDNAFQLVLQYHETLFGKIPVVFLGVNRFSEEMLRGKEDYITGIIQFAEVGETIKLALKLHPHTKTISILADATPTGQGYIDQVKEVEADFKDLHFYYISGKEYTTSEMLRAVEALPHDSILLFCTWVRDREGHYTPWSELVPEVTSRSPVPVYGVVDYMLDYGVIGGKVQSPVHHGLEAARMAGRILKGEDVANIPVQKRSTNVFMFDFASLKRWRIPEGLLPEGSIIVNKPLSPLEQYREWVIGGIIVCEILTIIIVLLVVNIYARKRAEGRIRESEERYRSLFKNSRDAISITTREGKVVDTNQAWRKLFGYTKEEIASIKAVALWQWPEERKKWIKEVETQGFVEDYPFTARTSQGESRLCLITTTKSRLKDGREVFQSIVRDITEKVEMERALIESQEKFSKAFDSSPDPMCITTLEDGVYLEVNEAFCKLTGWSKAETIGKTSIELNLYHNPAEREKRKELLLEQGTVRDYEITLISKEGRKHYLLWSAERVEISGKECILSILKDITERKLMEEKLAQEQQRFISLVENAPIGVSLVRKDGTYAYLNPTFVEIFGYTLEDIPDGKTWMRKAFPDEHERKIAISEWKERVKSLDRGGSPFTFTVTTNSGEKKIIKFRVVQLASGDYLVTYEDVTEMEMLQRQIIHAQKMESIGTLAGGVAHDFNNSLQAILGFTQLLLMEKSENAPDVEKLKKIEQTALKSKELVQRILTFSRKVESKRRPLDLNQEIKEIEKLLYRTIPKMIKIELYLEEGLKKINADPVQLEQVVMNIAVNARDAMPRGGVLTIETANITLSEKYAKSHLGAVPGDYVLLSISDTGEGMDKETLDRIFEPFFTTKEMGKGTGLGLSMVYGIVKDHGGYILCYSEKGKGTTFKIYFPVLNQEEERGPQAHSVSIKKRPKKKRSAVRKKGHLLMVVDDEKNILDVATHILNSAGYEVVQASSGGEALEIYREKAGQISLVILDYVMPEMDGAECMERLLEIDPRANILIASGFTGDNRYQGLMEKGAKGFVAKPFEMAELLKKIDEILDSEAGG